MYIEYKNIIHEIQDTKDIRIVKLVSVEDTTKTLEIEREELLDYTLMSRCDGCGCINENVRSDGYGFNCCYSPCDSYTVRGLSRSDFF